MKKNNSKKPAKKTGVPQEDQKEGGANILHAELVIDEKLVVPETQENVVLPFDEEAMGWMVSQDSIPGAYAPLLYIGAKMAVSFAKALGRQITLAEAKRMVQKDGEPQTCAMTGVQFQTVAYVAYYPVGFAKQVVEGKTILEARLPFGGQYYKIKGKFQAVSGSVWKYSERDNSYSFAHTSPMVMVAKAFEEETGKMKWGVPLGEISHITERKHVMNQLKDKARELVRLTTTRNFKRDVGHRLLSIADSIQDKKKPGKSEEDGDEKRQNRAARRKAKQELADKED